MFDIAARTLGRYFVPNNRQRLAFSLVGLQLSLDVGTHTSLGL
jgi:hypothetical protein